MTLVSPSGRLLQGHVGVSLASGLASAFNIAGRYSNSTSLGPVRGRAIACLHIEPGQRVHRLDEQGRPVGRAERDQAERARLDPLDQGA